MPSGMALIFVLVSSKENGAFYKSAKKSFSFTGGERRSLPSLSKKAGTADGSCFFNFICTQTFPHTRKSYF